MVGVEDEPQQSPQEGESPAQDALPSEVLEQDALIPEHPAPEGAREDRLSRLLSSTPDGFYNTYSRRNQSVLSKMEARDVKLHSRDAADSELERLARLHAGKRDELIIGNAGGADTIISLYGMLANAAAPDAKPHLLVLDMNRGNLGNVAYRLLTTLWAKNPWMNIADLLALPRKDVLALAGENGSALGKLEKLAKKFDYEKAARKHGGVAGYHRHVLRKEYVKFLAGIHAKHTKILGKRAANDMMDVIQDAIDQRFYDAVSYIPGEIHKDRDAFIEEFVATLAANPKTHYLMNPAVFAQVSSALNIADMKYRIHWAQLDLSKAIGVAETRRIVELFAGGREKVKPVSLAFMPAFERGFDAARRFLTEDIEELLYRKGEGDKGRFVTVDTDDFIPMSREHAGLEKYAKALRDRVVLTDATANPTETLPPAAAMKGMPRTMFIGPMTFGYIFSGQKEAEMLADIARSSKVEQVFVGGAIYGPHFYQQNKRRMLVDPTLASLDDQLRRFTEWRKSLPDSVRVTYIPTSEDEKITDDLFEFARKEYNRMHPRDRGDGSVWIGREDLNQAYDDLRLAVDELLWPYLLRAGIDQTRFFQEEPDRSVILDLIAALKRHKDGRNLREQDLELLVQDALTNSDTFSVVPQYKGEFKDGSLRVFPRTKFSRDTQYVNCRDAMIEWAKQAENGAIAKELPENVLVDIGQADNGFTVVGEKMLLWPGTLDDDRMRLDAGLLLPKYLHTVGDKGQKRTTIKRTFNLPSAMVVTGEPDHFFLEPYFPKVFETMEDIQRSGMGIKPVTVVINHDNQTGSITERPEMWVKFLDYGFNQRGATVYLGLGDHIHGRNYREMPIESGDITGASNIRLQQRNIVNILRPFFMLPQVTDWLTIFGNHEWNSDRDGLGQAFHAHLEGAIEQHLIERPEHSMRLSMPEFVVTKDGDLARAPMGAIEIGPYTVLLMHMYSQQGAGKGSSAMPSTHLASWMRNMSRLALEYHIALGAHYHILDAKIQDGKYHGVHGATAGESGYELMRQYGGVQPYQSLLHILPDGRISFEFMSERFLEAQDVVHPQIKAKGVDGFIAEAFRQPVYLLPGATSMKRIHRRELSVLPVLKVA